MASTCGVVLDAVELLEAVLHGEGAGRRGQPAQDAVVRGGAVRAGRGGRHRRLDVAELRARGGRGGRGVRHVSRVTCVAVASHAATAHSDLLCRP